MMRDGWNPTRRNRNIGTARSGHGQDNRLIIPSSRRDPRPFWSRLGPHATVTRTIRWRTVSFLVEPVRASCVHACTVDDLCHMLERLPGDWYWIDLFILRQPKRKEQTLRSCWGRLAYGLEVGPRRGPAVILEAADLAGRLRWPKSLPPDDVAELERLRADGHRITTTRREHIIHADLAAARATQLYRTLPHEIGHWVDYKTRVIMAADGTAGSEDERYARYFQRPSAEREAFAHRYADEISASLRRCGVIPFERIFDPASLRRDGLQPRDFAAPGSGER
jgi:hypothetical protein